VLTSLLFDVKPSDPMTLVGFVAAGRCGLAGLLHSAACRAAKVDPVESFRYE